MNSNFRKNSDGGKHVIPFSQKYRKSQYKLYKLLVFLKMFTISLELEYFVVTKDCGYFIIAIEIENHIHSFHIEKVKIDSHSNSQNPKLNGQGLGATSCGLGLKWIKGSFQYSALC
jgi:hypothetical protein